MKRSIFKAATVWVAIAAMGNQLAMTAAIAVTIPAASTEPVLTPALATGTAGAATASNLPASAAAQLGLSVFQTPLTTSAKIALLRQKVKYVFVLFQENRSFDHYFGTYPGANGLTATYTGASSTDIYAQPATSFGSYNSLIADVTGTSSGPNYITIHPFLVPRTIVNVNNQTVQLYPESILSVDHTHGGYLNDFNADANWNPQNNGYPLDQEGLHYQTSRTATASNPAGTILSGSNPPTSFLTLQAKQKGEVVMAHVDCDTIPFLWHYADVGTLFDNFHQTATGPSSPNAIAMIAGQVGDTQWVKHPSEANTSGPYLPMLTDGHPYPGSTSDTAAIKPPYGPDDSSITHTTINGFTTYAVPAGATSSPFPLTFASLPLSFMGHSIGTITASDENRAVDLADVSQDLTKIAVSNPVVGWGWYQQGYGPEPFDGTATSSDEGIFPAASSTTNGTPEHASYIVHHNGPQYFGYIGDNPVAAANLHSLGQFYTDLSNHALPAAGGVFYVRGGYYNNDNLTPADPNPLVQQDFAGNDDHGSYSDSQISEALIADSVNAIATATDANGKSIWSQSAIIITYDESDGFFDHQPEQFRTFGPDGQPETGGPRIPTIVLSPFAASHTVSHVYSEHSSVIKFINEVFGLTPLSSLPNEAAAMTAGAANAAFNSPAGFNGATAQPQLYLGPADGLANMGDLLEAFDNDRLSGNVAVLPAPVIPANVVTTLPHFGVTTASVSTVANATAYGCQNLGITPTDYPSSGYVAGGESDPPPQDFNPRPTVSTGSPHWNTSTNGATCTSTSTSAQQTICAQGGGGPWAN
jgi:phospholipase C